MYIVKFKQLCGLLWFCGLAKDVIAGPVKSSLSKRQYRNDYTYIPETDAFYKFNIQRKTWFEAKAYCNAEGSNLAVIKTAEEAELVKKFLNALPESRRNVWIGVQDLISEGLFETIDARPISTVYNRWDKDEPNNDGGNEDCVAFQPNGKLNDGNCDNKETFICKKEADTIKENVKCENFDLEYEPAQENQCIKFHRIPKTWDEAYMICNSEEGHLAIINSEEEARLYIKAFEKYPADGLKGNFNKESVHIGFHDKFTENEHVTVDGKLLSDSGYEEWFEGQPDNYHEEDCGSMARNGRLSDIGCNDRAMFICEKNLEDVLHVSTNARHFE